MLFISRARRFRRTVAGAILSFVLVWLAVQLVIKGYSVPWTGFGALTSANGEVVPGKTLWDWMELLVIPILLSIGVFFLNRSERLTERVIIAERERNAALQAYLGRITDLLLQEKLRVSKNGDVREVARIMTVSVLEELDVRRKRIVLFFLIEAGLIAREPIIDLGAANLNKVYLRHSNLSGISICRASLNDANLKRANLSGADLKETHFTRANLSRADLSGADLSGADLTGADLSRANLSNAVLMRTNLAGARLNGATVSDEQLAMVKSLKGAIMPNGKKHD